MFRSALVSLVLLSIVFPAAAEFQFDATGVTASITPNATAYWTCVCAGTFSGSPLFGNYHAIVTDGDGDGVVRWELGSPMKPGGVFTMIDGAAGTIATRRGEDGSVVEPIPFPTKAFLRDETGAYSYLSVTRAFVESSDALRLFWVRPGAGAWRGTVVDGGGSDDFWPRFQVLYRLGRMEPVDGSPAVPAGVQAGDFLVLTSSDANFWSGDRVDAHLGEAIGGGVIGYASSEGSEDTGKMTVTLARTEGTDGAASVRYATDDDSAHAGVDYVASSGTATFGPGQIFASFDVPLIDNAVDTLNPRFFVRLSEPSGAAIGDPSAYVAFTDNDSTPRVAIEQKSIDEGGSGPREAGLRIALDHTAPKPVRVEWEARDYFTAALHENGVVEFAAGEKEKSIVVHYLADDTWGANQRFRVVMKNAVNATPSGEGLLNIREDDPKPVMTFTGTTVRESAGNAVVTVNITAPLRNGILFYCETQNDTAAAPGDYVAKLVEMRIDAGATSTTLEIPIHDDQVVEGSESFRVLLHGGLNSAEPMTATVTILDDDGEPAAGRRRSMRH